MIANQLVNLVYATKPVGLIRVVVRREAPSNRARWESAASLS